MKKFVLILCPIWVLITACVSQGESNGAVDESAPSWVSQIPAESGDYYIGISGSNSGNQSNDQNLAYQKALKALASAISTEIQSDTAMTETESSEEGVQWSYESNISTSVSQNLENVETVDSYYSPQIGYWFYLRLSKESWEEVKAERANELKDLVDELFFDVFRDSLSELKAIDRGLDAYGKAYSGDPIRMELLGKRGSIETILLMRAEELLGEMKIQWEPEDSPLTQGDTIAINGRVILTGDDNQATHYRNPGPVTLLLIDSTNDILGEIQCEPDGSFSYDHVVMELPGLSQFTLQLKSPFMSETAHHQLSYIYPQDLQQVEILARSIGFILESNWESYGMYESAFNALEGLSPIVLNTEENLSQRFKMDISFRQAPPNEWDMIFSYARCYVSYVDRNGERVLWESEEYKEAGLDEDQANQRALESLMESLEDNQELQEILSQLDF